MSERKTVVADAKAKWDQGLVAKTLDKFPEQRKRFETVSGREVDRLYVPTADEESDYLDQAGLPGRVSLHARRAADDVPRPLLDDAAVRRLRDGRGVEPPLQVPAAAGQTGLCVAFDLPTQIGYDSDDPMAAGEVGKVGVAIDTLADMETLFDGIPLDKVSTSMTINATAAVLLAMYIAVAEKQGVAPPRARRHDPERHPEGVRRAGHLHLPAEALAAAHHRHLRLLHGARAEVEHDLDQRLPHPRGRRDRRAGDRLHAGRRHRLRRDRDRGRACRWTTSRRGWRSSSPRTTTCSRRWRSSARRGGSGRAS